MSVLGFMPNALISFKGEELISVIGDTRYIAFQLLEILYASKQINCKTYQNVLRMKTQYIKQ